MNTIRFTDEELRLVRNAMKSYWRTFGHDEADMLRAIRQVMARLSDPVVDAPESSTELMG